MCIYAVGQQQRRRLPSHDVQRDGWVEICFRLAIQPLSTNQAKHEPTKNNAMTDSETLRVRPYRSSPIADCFEQERKGGLIFTFQHFEKRLARRLNHLDLLSLSLHSLQIFSFSTTA